jgi:pyruvate dehydrogenase E2 component (dihydrolipoamide acetyltransferase)
LSSQVTLPRLGQGMESGTIVRWLKSEGDQVEKGEPLYELDTEKVTQEVEADASGVLLKILAGEGEEIEVGKAIAVIGEEGEDVPDAEPEAKEEPAEAEEAEEEEPKEEAEPKSENGRPEEPEAPAAAPEPQAEDGERAQAAPAAAAPAAAPTGEVEVIPLTGMRKTIARRMTEAWEAPAFQITMTADMSAAIRLREALVARMAEGDAKPTYSDILTKVCAVALMRHRAVNALFAGDEIHLQPTANVGIAVAVPNGLLVPVLRSCETKTIPQLAAERADVVQRTRENKLKQEDLEGGTFTISNLGMFGVERFVAVLNPPQAAILAVGAIEERAVVRDGELAARPVMEMTLSCDHRSIDGATASEFLRTVKQFLEEPGLAL